MANPKDVHVVPRGDSWATVRPGNGRASGLFDTQQLGMVVLSDTPALIDRLLLGVEQATRTAVAWPNGSPTVASRHNVYIFGISHLKTS